MIGRLRNHALGVYRRDLSATAGYVMCAGLLHASE